MRTDMSSACGASFRASASSSQFLAVKYGRRADVLTSFLILGGKRVVFITGCDVSSRFSMCAFYQVDDTSSNFQFSKSFCWEHMSVPYPPRQLRGGLPLNQPVFSEGPHWL